MSKTRALFESFQENLKMTRETIGDVDFSVNSGVVDGDIPEFEAKYNIKITNITEPGAHHNAVYSIEGNAEDVQRFKDEVLVEAEEPKQVLGEDSYETAEEVKAGVEKSGGLYQFIYDEWHNLPEEIRKEIALNAVYELNDDTKILEDLAERLIESEQVKNKDYLTEAVDGHNRFNKRGYNFVQYSYNNEEDVKILEELNNEPEVVVYDELYSDKNGIDPDSGKNYFDEYGCKIIYISGPLKGPNGPQEYMRYVIYKGTPEQVALFRTGGTGHTLRDAAEVDDICIATPKRLTESEETKPIELYMNTWGNYNENGANIKDGGWMNIEQAKEFLERHKKEEPFINDTNNCPIEVDEYDNPWEVIEKLEYIENCDNPEALIAIIESTSNNFEENKRIYESGDYTFFAGVDNDYDLGKAYYDMVGGVSGISEPENYVNREDVKQNLINNMSSDEDYSDEELDAMVDEDIEVAKVDNDESFFENYFDFETLGRELNYGGFYYADTGAIQTL